jgi:multidrug resistance efflux pump
MAATLLLLIAAFGQVSGESSAAPRPAGDPTFVATVKPLAAYAIPISAEVDGLINRMTIVEGQEVKKGDLLAAIDERHALAALEAAQKTLEAARARAEDDIEEQYATKAAAVARAVYEIDIAANRQNPGTISDVQLKKDRLDWERAVLQIEKAQKDRVLAGKEADVKAAELKAAEIALERRRILAPFDGEVQQLLLHQSEWANPGDPVLKLVRFDVLQVESTINSNDYDPAELHGRRVTVRLTLARNRQAAVEGRITYVDQIVSGTGDYGLYTIRAEVQNQRHEGFWLVRPGLPASMTVHVNEPPVEAAAQSARVER